MEFRAQNFHLRYLLEQDIAEAVLIEESHGLNSRGVAGYQKALSDPSSLIIVIVSESVLEREAPFSAVGGIFSGKIVLDELQIDNIAVAEGLTNQGLGTRLLKTSLATGGMKGCLSATLEVRSKNIIAWKFYRDFGFNEDAVRKNYYHNPCDDAILMSLLLATKNFGFESSLKAQNACISISRS